MSRIVLLGTSAAVPTAGHAPTALAVESDDGFMLVDCGENPLPRLNQVDLDPDQMRGVLLTHFHPDHAAAMPLLLVNLWLMGRTDPLPIFGLQDTLDRLLRMMDLFRWERWDDLYPVEPVEIAPRIGETFTEDIALRISAAPVEHVIPALGFRFEFLSSGKSIAYSGDTGPSQATIELARGADYLLHEATGAQPGHSSPAQAGTIAREAGVGRLILVHYPPAAPEQLAQWLEEAEATFGAPVELGQDLQILQL